MFMKNIKIQLVLFSFLVSITSIAQIPGYLGKRFSIGYSNYFFPRFPAVNSSIGFSDGDKLSTEHVFNSTHCLDVDYIISPRISMCFSGQFSKMDLMKQGSIFSVERGGLSYSVQYLPKPNQDMELNTVNFSVGFKFFKQRFLNPFGWYRKLELILMVNKVVMDEKGFYYMANSNPQIKQSSPYPLVDGAGRFSSIALAYTIGKQRIFFDKLILDWGIRFGINYSYVVSNLNPLETLFEYENSSIKEDTLESELKDQGNARIWGAQFVNAHVGLRFLAF
jgi:hypothetical protein